MKTVYKIFPILALSLMLSACQKFLDVKRTSGRVLIETANDAQLVLNDYSSMNTQFPSDGEASADDYYLNIDIYNNNGLADADRNLYAWAANAIRPVALPQWQGPYRTVYNANLVIEAAEKLKGKENQAVLDNLRGQALFFRAYSFWAIAQLYCNVYSPNAGSDPGIPLRLVSDINGKSDRGTVQQTYYQILADLKEALNLLNAVNPGINPSRPDKLAANAMLARVYHSMGDYASALPYATAVIKVKAADLMNFNQISTDNETPFNRFNPEVVFQSLMIPDPGLDPRSQQGPGARISEELMASYGPNDLRKAIFFKQCQTQDRVTGDYVYDGTYRFTGNYEPQVSPNLFNGLAIDEMFIIRAECYARAGNKDLAMTDLNTLLATRWVTGTSPGFSATDATDALNKVLLERRKELVMRGLRWSDDRRLKLSLSRSVKNITISNGVVESAIVDTYILPAGDPRFTLLIPQEVIDNAHGAIAQNAR